MKVSIFNNSICYGVDYSKRPDCTQVIDITNTQYQDIKNGYSMIQDGVVEEVMIGLIMEVVVIDETATEERYFLGGDDLSIPRRNISDMEVLQNSGYFLLVDGIQTYFTVSS